MAVVAWAGLARADVFRCKPDAAPIGGYSCLDGEVVGIVSALSPGDDPKFLFTMGDDAARTPRFPAPGEPFEMPEIDGSGHRVASRSHAITRSQHTDAGLAQDAHLVRLRVNAGRGSAPGEDEFHAELVEVLDGTKAYPLQVSKLAHATISSYESAQRWRAQLRKATEAAAKADKDAQLATYTSNDETIELESRVTWLPDTERMRVAFSARLSRVYRKQTKPPPPDCSADPFACGPYRNPQPEYVVVTHTYSATYRAHVDYDKTGKKLASVDDGMVVAPPTNESR